MGQVIPFPVRARAPALRAHRVLRIFRPQLEMLRALHRSHLLYVGTLVTTYALVFGAQWL